MAAILKEDPPELVRGGSPLRRRWSRVVNHCLEKAPEARFQSVRDMAFDLDTLSGLSSPSQTGVPAPARGRYFGRRTLPSVRWVPR